MVSDPSNDHLIRWTPEGNSFLITSCERVEREVFPVYFTSKKFASFVRQLNMYGFHKTGPPEHWEFYHEAFLRGRPELLQGIQRKKPQPGGPKPAAEKGDVKQDIATLKRERASLQEDVEFLREGQATLEAHLRQVVEENAAMLTELNQSRREQAAMQQTVQQILTLLGHLSDAPVEPPAKRARPTPKPTVAVPV